MTLSKYGGYTHTTNEVNLVEVSKQTKYSPRNKRLSETRTIKLYGDIIADTQAALIAKIVEIENAYANDFGDFSYTLDDGTVTHHLRNTADCISGVRVVQRPSFPESDGSQLVTGRGFSVTLQATYDAVESDLVSWEESIEIIGTGGPKFQIVETILAPIAVYTTINSAQWYIQSGRAVGYLDYPNPPGPVNPAGEMLDRRRIGRQSGRNMGNALRFFTRTWHYHMVRDVGTFGAVDYIPTSQ